MEASHDRPALTLDGLCLDLEGGSALPFSYQKEFSPSHAAKLEAKDEIYMHTAMKHAHAACEAEARVDGAEVCSLDAFGVLHGSAALGSATAEASAEGAARRKLLFRKRRGRSGSAPKTTMAFISIDAEGVAWPFDTPSPLALDVEGVVHDDEAIMSRQTTPGELPTLMKSESVGDRLKRFHRKKVTRAHSGDLQDEDDFIVCLDSKGMVKGTHKMDKTPLISLVEPCPEESPVSGRWSEEEEPCVEPRLDL